MNVERIERSLDPSQPKPYNVSRTMRQATIAATVFAPMAFLWYGSLNRVFPSSSLSHTFAKVALDQTAWAACMSYLLMAVSSLLEGKGLKAGLDKAGAEIWGVLKVNWCVWPLVQAINLSLVPVPLRILVMNVVAIPWTAFLAYKMNGSGGSRPPGSRLLWRDDPLKRGRGLDPTAGFSEARGGRQQSSTGHDNLACTLPRLLSWLSVAQSLPRSIYMWHGRSPEGVHLLPGPLMLCPLTTGNRCAVQSDFYFYPRFNRMSARQYTWLSGQQQSGRKYVCVAAALNYNSTSCKDCTRRTEKEGFSGAEESQGADRARYEYQ
eukprot:jgi/Mesvir1/28009/Mv20199-RA.1